MNRFKLFFGSFFSNGCARANAPRGMGGVFLGFLLALVVIVLSLFGGYSAAFGSMYEKSEGFKQTVREVFAGIGGVSVASDRARTDKIINTFDIEDDEIYMRHGIRVIVDTRPFQTTYGKFTPYYSDKSDVNNKDKRITAEQYAALDDDLKSNYVFGIERLHEAVDPEYHIDEYEAYFDGLDDKGKDYAALQEKRKDMSDRAYAEELYVLYVKSLYPEIGKFDEYGKAPTLRSYYLTRMQEVENDKFFIIFDSGVFGNFVTDGGVPVGFSGVFSSLNGKIYDGSAAHADMFIADAFSAAWSYTLNAYIMNGLSLVLFLVVTLLAISLIYFVVSSLLRFGCGQKFGECITVVGSFFFISSVIAGATIIGLSFALSREVMFNIAVPLFAAVVIVRTAVFAICEFVDHKKTSKANAAAQNGNGNSGDGCDNSENSASDDIFDGACAPVKQVDGGGAQQDGGTEANSESV